jgi:ammonium transporter Rh
MCTAIYVLSLLLASIAVAQETPVAPKVMGEELLTPSGQPGSVEDISLLGDELHKWNKDMDVWFMLMLVAFLMLFIKKFEWGICLATLLVTAGSFITYCAIKQFIFGAPWNQDMVILGVICAITVVIAIGVFLGTIRMWQYLLAGILFAPAWALIEWFMFSYLKGVMDPGGSMLVHMVAAYWGWGVILTLREKRAFDEPMNVTTHSISFVWLASMLLWVLWPSFVTALLPADQVHWGMVTCYMAGLGSIISTYIFCMIYEKKVNPLVYTYAMLCGPVAIGSPLLVVGPWGALLVGLGAGFISATCFIYLQPKLCKAMGVLDVMGVHNLHGVGGWFGAIVCAGIAAGGVNIVSAVGVFIISLVTGAITGGIIKATRGRMEDHELFRDDVDFSMWHEEPFELQEDGTVVKCE